MLLLLLLARVIVSLGRLWRVSLGRHVLLLLVVVLLELLLLLLVLFLLSPLEVAGDDSMCDLFLVRC